MFLVISCNTVGLCYMREMKISYVVQRLKAKIQKNRVNCDKSAKFGGEVFKIMYFQFFTSSSKFCSEKGEIYHF